MNTKTKSRNKWLKTIFCYLTAFVLLIIANTGLLSQLDFNFSLFASSGSTDITSTYLSNPNFNSNTSSTYLFDPDEYTPSLDANTPTVNAGVGNLGDSSCDYYEYPTNSSDENYVLIIDSKNISTTFGYTTDEEITLSAGSNYEITVDVLTDTSSGIGYLYLYDEDGTTYTSITGISTSMVWDTYHFFIKTSDVEDLTLTLGLFLNGNGVVMFDNITILELNDTVYSSHLGVSTGKYVEVDETDSVNTTTTAVDTTTFTLSSNNDISVDVEQGNTSGEAFDGTVTSALKISSDTATYGTLSTKDKYFTFNQNTIYKVTIKLKAVGLSGEVTLQLVETGLDDDEEGTDSTAISIDGNTSSDLYNNYEKFSFYINSYPTKTAYYQLVVTYGSSDGTSTATGTIYISTITTKPVNYSTFSSVTTGSNEETIDLTADYVQTNSNNEKALDNGNFNALEIENYKNPYPATATNWTVTPGDDDYQQYGIINTNADEFSKIDGLSNLKNPGDPYGTQGEAGGNNVLMMYSTSGSLTYTSNAVTLDAQTYHKFGLYVQTQNSPVTISLVTTDSNSEEITLVSLDVESEFAWSQVTLYIYTGYQDLDVSVKITLTTDSGYGYAYIDNATLDYLVQPSESTFNDITVSSTQTKVDLSNLIIATDSSSQFASTEMFTGAGSDSAKSGVINVNNNLDDVLSNTTAYSSVFSSISNDGNEYVLGIRVLDSDTYYTLTSRLGFAMTADSYYKISISVYTQFLVNVPEDADLSDYGASISLSDFEDTFTGIVSENKWTTYTFYICPSEDVTSYLTLGLASETAGIRSDAYFGNITFETIEEDEFTSATATKTSLVLSEVSAEEDSDTEEEEEEESSTELATILYYASTIIFAVAIIIAVVGVLVRRIHWKKPRKKTKTPYDRNKTVSKQYYQRKATTLREKKVREMTKEIDDLTAERTKYEEEYKKDLTTLRDLKIKRADKKEIANLEKQMKKNQKMSSSIGMSINRLESELEYVKSEAYLLNLSKKIANDENTGEQEVEGADNALENEVEISNEGEVVEDNPDNNTPNEEQSSDI